MKYTSMLKRLLDPAPNPGLKRENFRQICENGFGDGYNSFAHSMAWFNNQLYVGTTRANFCIAKVQEKTVERASDILFWPVESPSDIEGIYRLDRRAQLWCYEPLAQKWQRVLRAPRVIGIKGTEVDREVGYRGMAVFQGASDPHPVIYVTTWAPSRAPGCRLLRSEDGENFEDLGRLTVADNLFPSARVLFSFKDRLFLSPTGGAAGNSNKTLAPALYESRDPIKGKWTAASLPSFGDPDNKGIFMACASDDLIYAGTFNCKGYQVWCSSCNGDPPYKWLKLIDQGAERGSLNQIAICMSIFREALYVGSGIQGAGIDTENQIGPAASELIRIFPDGQWDLIVGNSRSTSQGRKKPLSRLPAGFGNFFNGYFWRSVVHEGWLYLGTCDVYSFLLSYISQERWKMRERRIIEQVGIETIRTHQSGCELWRSADGENWLPVTRNGFDNECNLGFRSLISSPYGLFVGTANPYGPRLGVKENDQWIYRDNPKGGLEVWIGTNPGDH